MAKTNPIEFVQQVREEAAKVAWPTRRDPMIPTVMATLYLAFPQRLQAMTGAMMGMVITPWMMSLLLFPGRQDDWQAQALGSKHSITFPSGKYRFLINVFDELGVCQMHSLHSPMHAFGNQAAAIAEATAFLDRLLVVPADGVQHDPVNEDLLGKILRGEKVPEMDKEGRLIAERPSRVSESKP